MKLPFDKIVPICISAYGYYIKALSYYLHTGFRRFPYYIFIFTNIEYVELGTIPDFIIVSYRQSIRNYIILYPEEYT